MSDENKIAALEAVLFVSGEPVAMERLCEIFEVTPLQLNQWLDKLESELNARGVRMNRIEEGIQLESHPSYTYYVEQLLEGMRPSRLSAPTLETLSIIAYRQPITRPEIEQIRGVKVERALSTLLSYDLITEVGRLETTGRPILYGTTDEFLRHFGLKDLTELPQ